MTWFLMNTTTRLGNWCTDDLETRRLVVGGYSAGGWVCKSVVSNRFYREFLVRYFLGVILCGERRGMTPLKPFTT